MKNVVKKIICLTLAAVMLWGCGKTGENIEKATESNNQTEVTKQVEQNKKNLVVPEFKETILTDLENCDITYMKNMGFSSFDFRLISTKELDKKNIVIVAGFQGLSQYYDVTTLGRGGSDTSAVGIAVALSADLCQIYTDVEGVYTADPRFIKNARKLKAISYDEMLELATLGAQVLNNRSVEIAKKHNVELEVLSSFVDVPGTIVREVANMEKMLISGVAKDNNVAKISITGIPDAQGWAFRIFSKLSARDINVDTILQSAVHGDKRDIFFTVNEDRLSDAVEALNKYCESIEGAKLTYDKNVAKISIVGAGMQTHAGVAAKMFEALFTAHIDIQMIATSEIKVSVIVSQENADEAVRTVHNAFFSTID